MKSVAQGVTRAPLRRAHTSASLSAPSVDLGAEMRPWSAQSHTLFKCEQADAGSCGCPSRASAGSRSTADFERCHGDNVFRAPEQINAGAQRMKPAFGYTSEAVCGGVWGLWWG
uniref:Uncharacterized protein n=1 Tax=Knipowitschia caucasica TaxID=637954 RepID=A0AAV2K0E5_KNICA